MKWNTEKIKKDMVRMIDPDKQYKVSGELLYLILQLSSLYNEPLLCIKGGYCEQGLSYRTDEDMQVVPFPSEKRDYLIGQLVQEFNHCDWEEV